MGRYFLSEAEISALIEYVKQLSDPAVTPQAAR